MNIEGFGVNFAFEFVATANVPNDRALKIDKRKIEYLISWDLVNF